MAPFLRRYALGPGAPFTAQLRECRRCGHRFFRERFTEVEMERLYAGYRDGEYLRIRQRLEPWYTARLNGMGFDPGVIAVRQQQLRHLLQTVGWQPGERRVVVDVGGDAGQVIPLDLSHAAYVVEASGRAPVAGVWRVASLAEVPRPAGLLLCLHLLEHLPDPATFLLDLVSGAALAPGFLLVLEVPLERPWLGPGLGSRAYQYWLEWLGRCLPLAIALDFPATVSRLVLGLVVLPQFVKLHEHVQFFTEDSLTRIVASAGLKVLLVESVRHSRWGSHRGVIRLVARGPGSAAGVVVRE